MLIDVKKLNLFRALALSLVLILCVSCTRENEGKSQVSLALPQNNLSGGLSSPGSQSFDGNEIVTHIIININAPGKPSIVWGWNNNEENTLSPPVAIPFEIDKAPQILFQAMVVYYDPDTGGELFRYGDSQQDISGATANVAINISPVAGSTPQEYKFGGRYISTLTPVPKGPFGTLLVKFIPPTGRPPMIIRSSGIFDGWFNSFGFDGGPPSALFQYQIAETGEVLFNNLSLASGNLSSQNYRMRIESPKMYEQHTPGDEYSTRPKATYIMGFFGPAAVESAFSPSYKVCYDSSESGFLDQFRLFETVTPGPPNTFGTPITYDISGAGCTSDEVCRTSGGVNGGTGFASACTSGTVPSEFRVKKEFFKNNSDSTFGFDGPFKYQNNSDQIFNVQNAGRSILIRYNLLPGVADGTPNDDRKIDGINFFIVPNGQAIDSRGEEFDCKIMSDNNYRSFTTASFDDTSIQINDINLKDAIVACPYYRTSVISPKYYYGFARKVYMDMVGNSDFIQLALYPFPAGSTDIAIPISPKLIAQDKNVCAKWRVKAFRHDKRSLPPNPAIKVNFNATELERYLPTGTYLRSESAFFVDASCKNSVTTVTLPPSGYIDIWVKWNHLYSPANTLRPVNLHAFSSSTKPAKVRFLPYNNGAVTFLTHLIEMEYQGASPFTISAGQCHFVDVIPAGAANEPIFNSAPVPLSIKLVNAASTDFGQLFLDEFCQTPIPYSVSGTERIHALTIPAGKIGTRIYYKALSSFASADTFEVNAYSSTTTAIFNRTNRNINYYGVYSSTNNTIDPGEQKFVSLMNLDLSYQPTFAQAALATPNLSYSNTQQPILAVEDSTTSPMVPSNTMFFGINDLFFSYNLNGNATKDFILHLTSGFTVDRYANLLFSSASTVTAGTSNVHNRMYLNPPTDFDISIDFDGDGNPFEPNETVLQGTPIAISGCQKFAAQLKNKNGSQYMNSYPSMQNISVNFIAAEVDSSMTSTPAFYTNVGCSTEASQNNNKTLDVVITQNQVDSGPSNTFIKQLTGKKLIVVVTAPSLDGRTLIKEFNFAP